MTANMTIVTEFTSKMAQPSAQMTPSIDIVSTTGLLELPPELRILIYSLCLHDLDPSRTPQEHITNRFLAVDYRFLTTDRLPDLKLPDSGTHDRVSSNRLTILAINRDIRNEALAVYLRILEKKKREL